MLRRLHPLCKKNFFYHRNQPKLILGSDILHKKMLILANINIIFIFYHKNFKQLNFRIQVFCFGLYLKELNASKHIYQILIYMLNKLFCKYFHVGFEMSCDKIRWHYKIVKMQIIFIFFFRHKNVSVSESSQLYQFYSHKVQLFMDLWLDQIGTNQILHNKNMQVFLCYITEFKKQQQSIKSSSIGIEKKKNIRKIICK